MSRKYTDHSGTSQGDWELMHRVPNKHNVHLYRVRCKQCASERELSFQRLTAGNVPCKDCADTKMVGNGVGVTAVVHTDRVEVFPRRTPEELVHLIPLAEQAYLQHARIFYGIGRHLLAVPNRFIVTEAPTNSLIDPVATAAAVTRPDGDCLEVMQSHLGYFDLGPEPETMAPEYIDTWMATHTRGTTYMQTPSTRLGWVWVRTLRLPVPAIEDDDWADLPRRAVDAFK